jgi:hypothetical protein
MGTQRGFGLATSRAVVNKIFEIAIRMHWISAGIVKKKKEFNLYQ